MPDTPYHLKVSALIGTNVSDMLAKSVEYLDFRNECLPLAWRSAIKFLQFTITGKITTTVLDM